MNGLITDKNEWFDKNEEWTEEVSWKIYCVFLVNFRGEMCSQLLPIQTDDIIKFQYF